MDPYIAESARKHGIADDAMLHAYRLAIAEDPIQEDFTMFIGPDHTGTLLEVGVVDAEDGAVVIVHAMAARDKYLKHLR